MKPKIDASKLLGFRLLTNPALATAAVKLGEKDGNKDVVTVDPADVMLGIKVGGKTTI